jgi:hypothetical protein
MKVDIIVDTNSFTHLAQIELKGEKPSTWLWKYFNVKTSSVVRTEFSVGIQNAPSNSKAINRRLANNEYILNTTRFNVLEPGWLVQFYYKKTLATTDLGERHLICSIAELQHYNVISRPVLVTDDLNAVDYFIKNVVNDLYFASLWTSLDLLVYLYFYSKDISFEEVVSGIRDIISRPSFSAKRYKERGVTDEFARQSMLGDYIRKLDHIRTIKNNLPDEHFKLEFDWI